MQQVMGGEAASAGGKYACHGNSSVGRLKSISEASRQLSQESSAVRQIGENLFPDRGPMEYQTSYIGPHRFLRVLPRLVGMRGTKFKLV